ncbi:MAG: hybrid sensor histidine kinase/response regulator [Magnetococcales bacterium]|nr:hybrid sensor histidine kinase/response regulator [Magnetococcales bacterium]
MIEDVELRELFQAESEEHLQKLDESLLHLEKHPDDKGVLKEAFREAHSLKGSARMLGVGDVETLAHRFEDVLGAASRGETVFTPDVVDHMMGGLDDIRVLVHEAVTGEPAGVSITDALARMEGKGAKKTAPPAPPETISPPPLVDQTPPAQSAPPLVDIQAPVVEVQAPVVEVQAPAPVVEVQAPAPVVEVQVQAPVVEVQAPVPVVEVQAPAPVVEVQAPAPVVEVQAPTPVVEVQRSEPGSQHVSSATPAASDSEESSQRSGSGESSQRPVDEESYRVDTIRVEPRRLDQLLNQAGELTVVKTRVKRRLTEIEEAIALWETSLREVHAADGHGLNGGEGGESNLDRLGAGLHQLRHAVFEDEAGLDMVARELEEGIRNLRLLPLSTIFNLYPRMVRDLARQLGKQVELILEGGDTTADKRVIEEMKSPLMHMIRNAVHHALEMPRERQQAGKPPLGTVRLKASRTATHVVIEVIDDGRGLDPNALRRVAVKNGLYSPAEAETLSMSQLKSVIFSSGFSTSAMVTDVSGRGVGLDVVRNNVERLKGSIQVDSEAGAGCLFTIRLPITLATTPVFIVSARKCTFAIPLDYVETVRRIPLDSVFPIDGRDTIDLNNEPVSVAHLGDLLDLPPHLVSLDPSPLTPCLVIRYGEERLGVFVDELLDEQEVVLKPHGAILKRVRNVSGATILGSGEVCMVLNPQDLIKTIQKRTIAHLGARGGESGSEEEVADQERRQSILLVEDSITTRTQEKRILESAGYDVVVAVDGLDALTQLGRRPFDGVVSDVQMPNLDGLDLTHRIRSNKAYQELPVILVTSLSSEEDMRKGMEVGANAYITKPTFDQKTFLDTLRRIV